MVYRWMSLAGVASVASSIELGPTDRLIAQPSLGATKAGARHLTRSWRGAAVGRWPPRAGETVSREGRWTALRRPSVGSRAVGKRKTLCAMGRYPGMCVLRGHVARRFHVAIP
jgi:hypothetical protein